MPEVAGGDAVGQGCAKEAWRLRVAAHPRRVLAAGLHGTDEGASALNEGHEARRDALHGDGGGVTREYAAHKRVHEGYQVRAVRQASERGHRRAVGDRRRGLEVGGGELAQAQVRERGAGRHQLARGRRGKGAVGKQGRVDHVAEGGGQSLELAVVEEEAGGGSADAEQHLILGRREAAARRQIRQQLWERW